MSFGLGTTVALGSFLYLNVDISHSNAVIVGLVELLYLPGKYLAKNFCTGEALCLNIYTSVFTGLIVGLLVFGIIQWLFHSYPKQKIINKQPTDKLIRRK